MKKTSFLLMGAAAIFAASCSNEDLGGVSGDTAVVTITASLPGSIGTRATSDGTTVDQVTYAVYLDGQSTVLATGTAPMANKVGTVTLTLVKGQSYDVLFWADKEGSPYTFDTETQTVSMNYSTDAMNGNDDERDAFYGKLDIDNVTSAVAPEVTLKRPFAQVNFGTTDVAAVEVLGFKPESMTYTVSVPKGIPTTLNLLTGETSDVTTDAITFAATGYMTETFPMTMAAEDATEDEGEDEETEVEETVTYTWLTMAYVLAPSEKQTVADDMTMTVTGTDLPDAIEVAVANVPIQRNYRTNIYGALLTEPAKVNVVINEVYDGIINGLVDEDGTYADTSVAKAGDLDDILDAISDDDIATILLIADIVLTDDTDLDLGGKTLDLSTFSLSVGTEDEQTSANVSITNGTVTSDQANSIIINTTGTVSWDGITFAGAASVDEDSADEDSSASSVRRRQTRATDSDTTYAVCVIGVETMTLKDCTIGSFEGADYGLWIPYANTKAVTLVVENCRIEGAVAGMLASSGQANSVTLTSSKIYGMTYGFLGNPYARITPFNITSCTFWGTTCGFYANKCIFQGTFASNVFYNGYSSITTGHNGVSSSVALSGLSTKKSTTCPD